MAVSVALVRTDRDNWQRPVYFVRKMLTVADTRYTDFERIALAFMMVAKQLCPYFQPNTIVALTSYPIKAILHKPDASGQLLKWAVELSEFDIEYLSRFAIKSQVLADFIVEMSDVQP